MAAQDGWNERLLRVSVPRLHLLQCLSRPALSAQGLEVGKRGVGRGEGGWGHIIGNKCKLHYFSNVLFDMDMTQLRGSLIVLCVTCVVCNICVVCNMCCV